MNLVERHIIKPTSSRYRELDSICLLSKNLYNQALYRIKQEYLTSGKVVRYNDLEKGFRENGQVDYTALPNNSSQQILMVLDKNIKSYFGLLKRWKKSKTSLSGCPKFPNYKDKERGRNLVIFTINQFKIKAGGVIYFPKKSGLSPIKTTIREGIQQVRVLPQASCYVIEVVYTVADVEMRSGDINASIDLGLNNLAAVTFSNSSDSLLINGRGIKSVNQYYKKRRSELQSDLMRKHGKKSSNAILRLTRKRNDKVRDLLHKSSRLVVNELINRGVSELVVGLNKEWKQGINIGSRSNQSFSSVPHSEFIEQLRYKCALAGINVITNEESYTSKTSAIDLEPMEKQDVYAGKREKRGMFRSKDGLRINADVNGSLNIGRKVFGDEYARAYLADRGYGRYPVRLNPDKCIRKTSLLG